MHKSTSGKVVLRVVAALVGAFVKVMPNDYRRVLTEMAAQEPASDDDRVAAGRS